MIFRLSKNCHLIAVFMAMAVSTVWADVQPLRMAEQQYMCHPNGMELEMMQDCGITLLSHFFWSPDTEKTKKYLAEAHRRGIRLLPYVSPEKAWFLDTPERLSRFNRRNPAAAIPYYQTVDPSSHPLWIMIDKHGRLAPRYGSYVKNDAGNWEILWGVHQAHGVTYRDLANANPWSWYMCSSVPDYIDAVEQGVRVLMEMGFDGVFVDNTYTNRLEHCHGEEFGMHRHAPPGCNTDKTYMKLAERIYKTVKNYGYERVVMLNGGLQDVYKPYRDAGMIESFVCASGCHERNHKWEQILESGNRFREESKDDRAVAALSYIGDTRYPVKDDCFYSYACAQLMGYKWSGNSPRMDIVRLLYRARLLVPAGELRQDDGLWYRLYDRGIVVVNPELDSELKATLPMPANLAQPVDLYTGDLLPIADGYVLVCIPPESGRVIVDRDDVFNNYLFEAATMLRIGADRIGRASAEELLRMPLLSGKEWKESARRAVLCADKLLELARVNQQGGIPRDAETMALLIEIQDLFGSLPLGENELTEFLRASVTYARSASRL